MATKTPQSSLVIRKFDGFGGNFIDSDYLGYYFASKPYIMEGTIMKMYSSTDRFFTGGKLLQQMLGMGNNAAIKEIDGEIWRWKLQGAEHKAARIVEVVESSTAPGLANSTFRIKLDLNYFANPDVLMGEDNEYPLEIVNGPIPDGVGYVYEVRIQGDNPSIFFPVSELQVGKRFDKVWTSVSSEFNQVYGTQQAPSSFELENQLGYFAQKLEVTDKALRVDGRLGIDFLMTDASGRSTKISKFIPYYEARMQSELYNGIEAQLVYGKRQTRPGIDGYSIKTGMGLREQLKDSWLHYYNGALTVALLRDYLMDIFFTRANESNRSVKIIITRCDL